MGRSHGPQYLAHFALTWERRRDAHAPSIKLFLTHSLTIFIGTFIKTQETKRLLFQPDSY